MKSSAYWAERFEILEEARFKKVSKEYASIEKAYRYTEKSINAEIEKWYGRLASNNEVSLEGAHKLLSDNELKEFKWTVSDYIKHGRNNIDGRFAKELENASSKFHISRLESIKLQTRMSIESLLSDVQSDTESFLAEIYRDSYYRTAFEVQKGTEIGFTMSAIDDKKIADVLRKPWTTDRRTFSDRIWANKAQLIDNTYNAITRMCIMGQNPQTAIADFSEAMHVSKYQAGRLIMTESAYFASLSEQRCYNDLGVKEFKVLATLDNKTSVVCQEMDGKHFPMSDYKIGTTAPPFHPNCRSCTAPYFDDEFTENSERIARNEQGKTYKVPANMTYKEWKEKSIK